METQLSEQRYSVPGMSCGHCERAIRAELEAIPGVGSVEVDLATKLVTVRGADLDDRAIRASIVAAGYEADARGSVA